VPCYLNRPVSLIQWQTNFTQPSTFEHCTDWWHETNWNKLQKKRISARVGEKKREKFACVRADMMMMMISLFLSRASPDISHHRVFIHTANTLHSWAPTGVSGVGCFIRYTAWKFHSLQHSSPITLVFRRNFHHSLEIDVHDWWDEETVRWSLRALAHIHKPNRDVWRGFWTFRSVWENCDSRRVWGEEKVVELENISLVDSPCC
jgi:hypothetical protein